MQCVVTRSDAVAIFFAFAIRDFSFEVDRQFCDSRRDRRGTIGGGEPLNVRSIAFIFYKKLMGICVIFKTVFGIT